MTQDSSNSWICLEFQNHQIIPTENIIRSRKSRSHTPTSFEIEVSTDNSALKEIDGQNGVLFPEGKQTSFYFLLIKKQKETKYIHLQTGKTSTGNDYLNFVFIEFYGYLK